MRLTRIHIAIHIYTCKFPKTHTFMAKYTAVYEEIIYYISFPQEVAFLVEGISIHIILNVLDKMPKINVFLICVAASSPLVVFLKK